MASETTIIQISLPGLPQVRIAAIYASPSLNYRLLVQDLNSIVGTSSNFLVAGDFNAHHHSWGCINFNVRGVHLRRWIDHKLAHVISPPSPTCYVGRNPSVIDFGIACNIPFSHSCNVINDLSSDHLPVKIRFDVESMSTDDTRSLTTHWDNYRHLLSQDGYPDWPVDSRENAELAIRRFRDSLLLAFARASKPRTHRVDYYKLPAPIRELIRERNQTRRDWQSSRDPALKTLLNRQNSVIRREIRIDSTNRFNNYIESLTVSDCSIWRATRIIRKKKPNIPVLKTDDKIAVNNREKCELIADSLSQQFAPNHDVIDIPTFGEVIPRVQNFLMQSPSDALIPASPDELLEYTSKLKKNKAPGFDNISTNMLIYLPANHLVYLTFLINCLLKLKYFPACWKEAIVVPIHKPGSVATNPVNYRPISLLSALSKIYEFILARRLDDFIYSNNILRPEQMGFRSRHSTQHQLWRVVEYIHSARESSNLACVVFVDISKAFDKIWHDGLIYKLIQLNLPAQLIHILSDYLTNRSYRVRVDKEISSPHSISSGVPQGSLLGPKLFNLYINDMPSDPNIDLAFYADDTAFMCSARRHRTVFQSLQNYLNIYSHWLRKWRVKVNADKSAAVIFHKYAISPPGRLLLNNDPIPWADNYKYLGVILDSKLNWRPQIADLIRKSKAAKGSLRYLFTRSSRLSLKNKLLLFKTCIRPIMTYGCIVWGCTAATNLQKLQVIQNKMLKLCTNSHWYERMDKVHQDLRIRTFLAEIKKLAWKFHRGIPRIPNPVLHSIPAYDASYSRSAKRPRALLDRPDDTVPAAKRGNFQHLS